jgi:glyoxylase-like metal-dependent hydrolase (beta-lactamase superfamily II)
LNREQSFGVINAVRVKILSQRRRTMTSLKWRIGEVVVFQIVELEAGAIIQSIFKQALPETIRDIRWLYPHFVDEVGNFKALVQSFLIKSDANIILIDTCIGNAKARTDVPAWANLQTDFLKNLSDLGVTATDVNVVACTHLHMDHVGWNTKYDGGVWGPTFPKAKYLFVREEYEYWMQKPARESADDKAAFDDSVTPIMNAGLAELVAEDYRIDRHVSFIPTAGHSHAHVSVLIESQHKRAIISGDILHHPCQIAKPHWTVTPDMLPDKALMTRQRLLDQIAGTDTLLIGSHFANPVAGRVGRSDEGFIFEV